MFLLFSYSFTKMRCKMPEKKAEISLKVSEGLVLITDSQLLKNK